MDSRALFDEQLAYHRPGEKIAISYSRNGIVKETELVLTNKQGTVGLEKKSGVKSKKLGAEFEEITRMEKGKYNIPSGIRIFNITNGTIRNMNLPENFIILKFNNEVYNTPSELIASMEGASGRIIIEGITPNGQHSTFQFYSN